MAFPGTSFPGGNIPLHLVAQDAKTLTVGWNTPSNAGFRFASENGKGSHTWDNTRRTVRFATGSSWYRVEALDISGAGEFRP